MTAISLVLYDLRVNARTVRRRTESKTARDNRVSYEPLLEEEGDGLHSNITIGYLLSTLWVMQSIFAIVILYRELHQKFHTVVRHVDSLLPNLKRRIVVGRIEKRPHLR